MKHIKIPEELHAYLDTAAHAKRVHLQDLAARILREWALDPANAIPVSEMRARLRGNAA